MESDTTSSINYERQASLPLNLPSCVAVVGCGGVGSWTAYLLALAGVPKLYLFDQDTVSDHNLNRIPLPPNSVGEYKSKAVADLIASVRPDCIALAMGNFDTALADRLVLASEARYIVATTDSRRSRELVSKWAGIADVPFIECAAEGEIGSATGEPGDWQTVMEDHPGYASVPVWCGPCVNAASLAVSYIVHGKSMGDRTIRIGFGAEGTEIFDSELEYA